MGKVFEDRLSGYLADMVGIAAEYAAGRADEIFIHGACEEGMSSFDFFFRIGDRVVQKEHLSGDATVESETEDARLSAALNFGLDHIDGIAQACEDSGRDLPTEMRLHYHVATHRLTTQFRYDRLFSDDPERLPGDVFDAWMDSVSKEER